MPGQSHHASGPIKPHLREADKAPPALLRGVESVGAQDGWNFAERRQSHDSALYEPAGLAHDGFFDFAEFMGDVAIPATRQFTEGPA